MSPGVQVSFRHGLPIIFRLQTTARCPLLLAAAETAMNNSRQSREAMPADRSIVVQHPREF